MELPSSKLERFLIKVLALSDLTSICTSCPIRKGGRQTLEQGLGHLGSHGFASLQHSMIKH